MSTKEVQAQELKTFEQEDSAEQIPPSDIVAYNELRSCADLFRLYSSGKLEIQPDFQRDVVWNPKEQTRFIDSLVKQLPIPSMCFSLDYKTQKWKVIDGLQRMSSIIHFLSTDDWKLVPLDDIQPELRGVTNNELRNGSETQRRLFSLVEDVSIPITVIRCDYSISQHMRYLFTIFYRLNSGGVRLNNQEIRNCIYTGTFNNELKIFDKQDANWRLIKARIWGKTDRFRSVEILLRTLAFGEWLDRYDGNLAGFLNNYMHHATVHPPKDLSLFRADLAEVSRIGASALGATTRRKVPLALAEAALVAIFTNRGKLRRLSSEQLQAAFSALEKDPVFAESARYAVSSLENVNARMRRALSIFSA